MDLLHAYGQLAESVFPEPSVAVQVTVLRICQHARGSQHQQSTEWCRQAGLHAGLAAQVRGMARSRSYPLPMGTGKGVPG